MDLLLELPLDALASRLHSLPAAVGLLSTWLAVLAAALGLWRIRVVGSSKSRSLEVPAASFTGLASHHAELVPPEPERSHLLQASPEDKEDCAEPASPEGKKDWAAAEPASPSRCAAWEGTATTKTRFVAYYESSHPEDGDDGDDDDSEETGEEENAGSLFEITSSCCEVGAVAAPWRGDWASLEDVVMARTGDLGWYRCQDWTRLNGSVVRLWDGGRDGGAFTAKLRRVAW